MKIEKPGVGRPLLGPAKMFVEQPLALPGSAKNNIYLGSFYSQEGAHLVKTSNTDQLNRLIWAINLFLDIFNVCYGRKVVEKISQAACLLKIHQNN